ncbi:MAG: hypothetical protein Harvfovirus65_1, partial [Harvfovirus sp.]
MQERCSGTTMKGPQCERYVDQDLGFMIKGKRYCAVHFGKTLHYMQNNSFSEIIDDDSFVPADLLRAIPDALVSICEKMGIRELEYIFLNMHVVTMGDSFEEAMKNSWESKIPDKYLVEFAPEVLKDVRYMKVMDLNRILDGFKSEIVIRECESCRHEHVLGGMVQCTAGHKFCADCLMKYVKGRIYSRTFNLSCVSNVACKGG